MAQDPYEVLEVSRDAAPEIIQLAWLRKSRTHDPQGGTDPNPERREQVDAAFELLRDPATRSAWDADNPAPTVTADSTVHWPTADTDSGAAMVPAPAAVPSSPAPAPPGAPASPRTSGPPPPPGGSFAGGAAATGQWVPAAGQKTNPLAIVALVLFFVFTPLGFLVALIARYQINRSNGAQKGKGITTFIIAFTLVGVVVLLALSAMISSGAA